MLLFGLCLYMARYKLYMMERVSFYFTPVVSVALTNAITRQRTKKVSNVIYVICVGLCIILFLYRCSAQLGDYHPYWEYLERRRVYW